MIRRDETGEKTRRESRLPRPRRSHDGATTIGVSSRLDETHGGVSLGRVERKRERVPARRVVFRVLFPDNRVLLVVGMNELHVRGASASEHAMREVDAGTRETRDGHASVRDERVQRRRSKGHARGRVRVSKDVRGEHDERNDVFPRRRRRLSSRTRGDEREGFFFHAGSRVFAR